MKEYKQLIVDTIVKKAQGERIVSLYDVARELGHKHIAAQDCRDIMRAVLTALPEYKAVQMLTEKQMRNPATAGLFTTLTFVEKGIVFDDGTEFIDDGEEVAHAEESR